jgi:predicted nucleotidyltransferase
VTGDAWDRGPSDPRQVLEVLTRRGVDFTVIGGFAVIAHGHPRNTRDIDFVAAPDHANLQRVAETLRDLNGGLNFFNEVPGGVPYAELRERALVVELAGLTIRVAGRDDLIRMKQAAGRPQDLDDIAALTRPQV